MRSFLTIIVAGAAACTAYFMLQPSTPEPQNAQADWDAEPLS
ncbi:MAG: hypothetical protein AAF613_03650 [Pseudomonadota bacterium]